MQDVKIIRSLESRDITQALKQYRKSVFLAEKNKIKVVVIKINSEKYRPIFDKYLKALSQQNTFLPELLQTNSSEMTLVVSYEGKNILKSKTSYAEAVRNLKTINLNNHKSVALQIPRYVVQYNQQCILYEQLIDLREMYQELASTLRLANIYIEVGDGIEDPSLTNFCRGTKTVCLVDLDNYSNFVNFEYELGFMFTDLFVRREIDFDTEKLLTYIKKYYDGTLSDINTLLIYIGSISMLTTLVLDMMDKKPNSIPRFTKYSKLLSDIILRALDMIRV